MDFLLEFAKTDVQRDALKAVQGGVNTLKELDAVIALAAKVYNDTQERSPRVIDAISALHRKRAEMLGVGKGGDGEAHEGG